MAHATPATILLINKPFEPLSEEAIVDATIALANGFELKIEGQELPSTPPIKTTVGTFIEVPFPAVRVEYITGATIEQRTILRSQLIRVMANPGLLAMEL